MSRPKRRLLAALIAVVGIVGGVLTNLVVDGSHLAGVPIVTAFIVVAVLTVALAYFAEGAEEKRRGAPRKSFPKWVGDWRPRTKIVAVVAALAVAVVAGFWTVPRLGRAETVNLSIGSYGSAGQADTNGIFPAELLREYEKHHRGVHIQVRTENYEEHQRRLEGVATTGESDNDLELIEQYYAPRFAQAAGRFVDLRSSGADLGVWPRQALAPATAADGRLIGLPLDAGGLAVCYRRDLFRAAGLPVHRDDVARLLDTWPHFVEAGRRYQAAAGKAHAWVSSATDIFVAALSGAGSAAPEADYDASSDPVVRRSWDLAVRAAPLSASTLDADFAAGVRDARFATTICPAWRMARIRDAAASDKGMWDVAPTPGIGGDWGGTVLAVPASGPHTGAAAELAAWLTAPDQQVATFQADHGGGFPTAVTTWDDDAVVGHTDAFFSDAPTGRVIAQSLGRAPHSPASARAEPIALAVQPALRAVEDGKDPAEEWVVAQRRIEISTR